MSVSKATLQQRIKNELQTNYKNFTTLASAMAATGNSALVAVNEGNRLSAGDLLEVENEVFLVRENPMLMTYTSTALNATDTYFTVDSVTNLSAGYAINIDSETLAVTVVSASTFVSATRGEYGTQAASHSINTPVYNPDAISITRAYQGTTAATHASGVTVNVVDLWTLTDIDRSMLNAIRYLYPTIYKDYRTDIRTWGQTTSDFRLGDDNDSTYVAQWSAKEDAIAPVISTDTKDGSGAMALGLTVGQSATTYGEYDILMPTAINTLSADFVNFNFHIEDLTDSSGDKIFARNMLGVRVGNTSAAYYEYFVPEADLREGDNVVSIPFKNGALSGTVSLSSIAYANFRVYENPYNPTSVASGNLLLDGLEVAAYPRMNTIGRIELPKYVESVGKVRSFDNSGDTYKDIFDFNIRGSDGVFQLEMNGNQSLGHPLELYGEKRYELDSGDNLDIPEYLEQYLVMYATRDLIRQRMPELLRFDKYSAKTQKETGTRLDYIRQLSMYDQYIANFLTNHAKSKEPQELDFGG